MQQKKILTREEKLKVFNYLGNFVGHVNQFPYKKLNAIVVEN